MQNLDLRRTIQLYKGMDARGCKGCVSLQICVCVFLYLCAFAYLSVESGGDSLVYQFLSYQGTKETSNYSD